VPQENMKSAARLCRCHLCIWMLCLDPKTPWS